MNESHPGTEERIGAVQLAVLVLTIINFCALIADTVCALPKDVSEVVQKSDTFVCVVFLLDFVVRLYRAKSKWAFLKWGWIDLVASIPNLDVLRWGRMVRVLRIIRLLRGIRSIQKVFSMTFQNRLQAGSVSLALTAFLLITFASVSVLVCERHGDTNIKTAEDAVWWSVTTMTTVGYGDKYPVTTEGRIVGMILMICGVGMFGGLSGMAASLILGTRDQKPTEIAQVLARLDQMQAKLDFLARELAKPS